jgi:hypothetical protein
MLPLSFLADLQLAVRKKMLVWAVGIETTNLMETKEFCGAV